MNTISPQLPSLTSFDNLTPNEGNLRRTTLADISLQVEKGMEIAISTADGDKVTINSRYSLETAYVTYNDQGLVNGNSVQTDIEAFYFSEQFEFEMTIEGDLTRKELKDIRKTLHILEKMMKSIDTRHERKAFDKVAKIAKLDSISSLEAIFAYRQVEQASIRTSLLLSEGTGEIPQTPLPQAPALTGTDQSPEAPLSPEIAPPSFPVAEPETLGDSTLQTPSATPEGPVSVTPDSSKDALSIQTDYLVKKNRSRS